MLGTEIVCLWMRVASRGSRVPISRRGDGVKVAPYGSIMERIT